MLQTCDGAIATPMDPARKPNPEIGAGPALVSRSTSMRSATAVSGIPSPDERW